MKCSKCKSRYVICRAFEYVYESNGPDIVCIDYYFYCIDCGRSQVSSTRSNDNPPKVADIVFDLFRKFTVRSLKNKWFWVNIIPVDYVIERIANRVNYEHDRMYPKVGFNK